MNMRVSRLVILLSYADVGTTFAALLVAMLAGRASFAPLLGLLIAVRLAVLVIAYVEGRTAKIIEEREREHACEACGDPLPPLVWPIVTMRGDDYLDVMRMLRRARAQAPDWAIDGERIAARVLSRPEVEPAIADLTAVERAIFDAANVRQAQ